ncbi:MAG: transaldolase [Actinomycetota bacterium]
MGKLQDLYDQQGQSPWLDNLRRGWITSGELQGWIDRGVRGLTSNPSIFAKAMIETDDYDAELGSLAASGTSIEDAYWQLVVGDIRQALDILRPVHDASGGEDGYVSVEVSPELANDEAGTVVAARELDDRIEAPNLYIKVPATAEGVPAIKTLVSEARSINVTLIFSLERYQDVMEAYISGLEAVDADDLSSISSVASFFISRVDVEVDRRLNEIGTEQALALRGKAAVAQGQLAYQRFLETFSGPRWDALAAKGARLQRPLWASTSTKDPSYPDTLYVDTLIGPNTVNTLPDNTLLAFEDHGIVARTVDADPEEAMSVVADLAALGIDLEEVAVKLEAEGVGSFAKSFEDVLATLGSRAEDMTS